MKLSPWLQQKFTDANGAPLVGGELYSYEAGTSTPQATYVDEGGTPNTNPVTLDSEGACQLWLDEAAAYKFVLKDADGVTLQTWDDVTLEPSLPLTQKGGIVVGGTGGAPTELAPGANGQYLTPWSAASSGLLWRSFLPPEIQRYTSGSGTHKMRYVMEIVAGNAFQGDTYSDGATVFTIAKTISGASILYVDADGDPNALSGVLTLTSGSGDGTITFKAWRKPIAIEVEMVGGGGGGQGNSTSNGGGTGGNTSFGSDLIAGGGGGGPSAGGTASISGSWVKIYERTGASGGTYTNLASSTGGGGGVTPFGGGGFGGSNNSSGSAAAGNTGAGGGGGGAPNGNSSSGGGSAGAYIRAMLANPASSYAYAVGAGGAGGTAGSSYAGGNGGSGIIIVKSIYQ